MRQRHVPTRSCVVCGTKVAKRELVRVVLTPHGDCQIDETGKLPGRGAYLCHKSSCWEKAVKGGRLAHALRADVGAADKERLTEYATALSATTED